MHTLQIPYFQNAEFDASGRYTSDPNTPRGQGSASTIIVRIVVPAVLFAGSAVLTRFWWWIPFTDKPGWFEEDDRFATDWRGGMASATEAGAPLMGAGAGGGLLSGIGFGAPDGAPARSRPGSAPRPGGGLRRSGAQQAGGIGNSGQRPDAAYGPPAPGSRPGSIQGGDPNRPNSGRPRSGAAQASAGSYRTSRHASVADPDADTTRFDDEDKLRRSQPSANAASRAMASVRASRDPGAAADVRRSREGPVSVRASWAEASPNTSRALEGNRSSVRSSSRRSRAIAESCEIELPWELAVGGIGWRTAGPVAEADNGAFDNDELRPRRPEERVPARLSSSDGGASTEDSDDAFLLCTEVVGPNWQLLSVVGLVVAIAFTIDNMRIGTGFGCFFYIGSMSYGYLAWRAGTRKVPLYWQEAVLAVMFLVLWAISYAAPSAEEWIQGIINTPDALVAQQYFPFILHSPLAALSLASILAGRPFTLQYVLETVKVQGWSCRELLPGAYYTSTVWFMAHTMSVFSYLIAYQVNIYGQVEGQYRSAGDPGSGDNGFTVLLTIVIPILLCVFACVFTRFWYLAVRPAWATRQKVAESQVTEESSETEEATEEEPEPQPDEEPENDVPDWQLLYQQQWADYVAQLWHMYNQYMQYNVPPPPPPEPPKPVQAAGVPRYALLPGGKLAVPTQPAESSAPGLLGWGDEAFWGAAAGDAALRQQLQHPVAKFFDTNHVFVSSIGYIVATASQAADVRAGCLAAWCFYLATMVLGYFLARARVRKVPVFFLEVTMFVLFLLLFALTFPDAAEGGASSREFDIARDFTFIVNGVLCGIAMVRHALDADSLLTGRLTHIEFVMHFFHESLQL
uniref:Uncharacterized protein n=1 Tax=Chlamydomonas euryale TaxID=1486919 RepID=A0A6U2I9K4_9CHLO|mmetsp:Transcript_42603/g.127777  ORF Transcript_42603/g.127777 Transcript_42603/m.127777 type:complete len:856 (+) Transcript_42603:1939-4506(+)